MRKLPLKSLRFLDWLFHPSAFRLKEITVDEFNAKTSFHSETAGAARSGSLPQHIFEVVYDESPSSSTSGAGLCRAHTSTSKAPTHWIHTLAAAFALEALQRYQSVAQKHGTVVGYFSQPPVVRSSQMPVRLTPLCSRKSPHRYHASSLENFHSILWNGLDTKYSKQGLFGEGAASLEC